MINKIKKTIKEWYDNPTHINGKLTYSYHDHNKLAESIDKLLKSEIKALNTELDGLSKDFLKITKGGIR